MHDTPAEQCFVDHLTAKRDGDVEGRSSPAFKAAWQWRSIARSERAPECTYTIEGWLGVRHE
jgi:hypothetical protein